MELASRQTHRALAYAAALNKHGHFPTVAQFAAYASNPDPKPAPGIAEAVATMMTMYSTVPAESILAFLVRVEWVSHPDGRVRITDPGSAVLAALDEGAVQAQEVVEVVLTSDDPLALSRAVTQLVARGAALLVDPYFRLDQLSFIVGYTAIDRVLMSEKVNAADRTSLKHALDTVPWQRRVEVRVATKEKMHDRFVIPPQGSVTSIGTSLNALGQGFTVLGQLGDASAEIRRHYDVLWQGAERLPQVQRRSRSAFTARSTSLSSTSPLSRLRVLSGREVCRILAAHGFEEVRRRGSHVVIMKGAPGEAGARPERGGARCCSPPSGDTPSLGFGYPGYPRGTMAP